MVDSQLGLHLTSGGDGEDSPWVELRNELFKDSRVMTYLETLDIDVMQSEPREISGRHGAVISVIRSTSRQTHIHSGKLT